MTVTIFQNLSCLRATGLLSVSQTAQTAAGERMSASKLEGFFKQDFEGDAVADDVDEEFGADWGAFVGVWTSPLSSVVGGWTLS
jgi:hypothetical protein